MSLKDIDPEYVTRRDLQKILRVSQATVFRWLADNTLPQGMLLGQKRVWRRAEIERWMADREAAAGAPRGTMTLTNGAVSGEAIERLRLRPAKPIPDTTVEIEVGGRSRNG